MTQNWQVEEWSGSAVWEFEEDMTQDEFHTDEFAEAWRDAVVSEEITGVVTEFKMDEAFTPETFARLQELGRTAVEHGVDHWMVVAEGPKEIAIRGRIGDVEDLETHSRSDMKPALAKMDNVTA